MKNIRLMVQERVFEMLKSGPAWMVLLIAVVLTAWGVIAIDTVKPSFATTQVTKQIPVSIVAAFLCALIPSKRLGLLVGPCYVFSTFLLIYLFIPGAPLVRTINGATSWMDLEVMNFQPAELAKVTYVLMMAWFLRFRQSHRSILGLCMPAILTVVPLFLILIQPDLGSALLFFPTFFVMLLAAGGKLRHQITVLMLGFVCASTVAFVTINSTERFKFMPEKTYDWHVLKSHQEDRILALYYAWIGDLRMANDEGFQQARGMQVIGAAKVNGYGEDAGSVVIANALPEPHNDMIYCVLGTRWGALGTLGAIAGYTAFLFSVLWGAVRCADPFMRLSMVGFGAMLYAQAMINIAMCLGLMPITGITLPFVSYGGSSLLSCWAMVGLLVNFASRPRPKMVRSSFEFEN